MKKEFFGTLKTGEKIHKYTLSDGGAVATVMEFGAAIVSFDVLGKSIIGGYSSLDDYIFDTSHQGAIVGRVANRIAGASFEMDGKRYSLPKNNNGNCLHGGIGYDRKFWTVEEYDGKKITLSYTSPDGEEGFPGKLLVKVTYTVSENDLKIDYLAIPDSKTPIALTNHSYFNLNGFGDTVLSHKAQIFANEYTEVDENLIPNGNRPAVEGTVFDLRTPKAIGQDVGADFAGYDHNFILTHEKTEDFDGKALGLAAIVEGDELILDVYTDQPGVQFYMGNFLGGAPDFAGGIKRIRHGAFCLETQTEPNCVNHGIGFYDKGEAYTHTTVYRVRKK